MPLGSQVKTQKSPMHARDKHAWGVVDVFVSRFALLLSLWLAQAN